MNNFLDAIDGSYCSFSAYGETGNSPLDPPYPDPNPGGYKGQLQCGVYTPTHVISISYGGQEPVSIIELSRGTLSTFTSRQHMEEKRQSPLALLILFRSGIDLSNAAGTLPDVSHTQKNREEEPIGFADTFSERHYQTLPAPTPTSLLHKKNGI